MPYETGLRDCFECGAPLARGLKFCDNHEPKEEEATARAYATNGDLMAALRAVDDAAELTRQACAHALAVLAELKAEGPNTSCTCGHDHTTFAGRCHPLHHDVRCAAGMALRS